MSDYNNILNFKNPIRHFINIDSLDFPDIGTMSIEDTCWTIPFKFRIMKDESDFRVLKIPNILQLVFSYENIKEMPSFSNPQDLDIEHKRLTARLETGDFKVGAYEKQLEGDFKNLCIYDYLLKLDIKEYYGRIYTHYLDWSLLNNNDRYITNLNNGATNGLLMGNYLSLYLAEQFLAKISGEISNKLDELNIKCKFSYFSDDFYFFCNKRDREKITSVFDLVLDEFDLTRNDRKCESFDYEQYTANNLMTRYWKRINRYCNTHKKADNHHNRLVFINQLMYRIKDFDIKQKRTFINSFFKGKYFRKLETELYEFKEYDYHELCYLFRLSPEAMLYSMDIFLKIRNFDVSGLTEFFKVRYEEALKNNLHDVQLYYYYAICLSGLEDEVLKDTEELVLQSENQLIISYYLLNERFNQEQINTLKSYTKECYWFQNYHLILKRTEFWTDLENSINTYLIPECVRPRAGEKQSAVRRRKTYMDFYKKNLMEFRPILVNEQEVCRNIQDYLYLRIEEEEALYETVAQSQQNDSTDDQDDCELPF